MPTDDAVAELVATEAGQLLRALREELAGEEPSTIRAEGDRRSQAFIADRLAALRPEDCILSEEAADDSARVDRPRVWIVDPLDG
ncbi:MAG TPA: inositol monophosphatase family protein, partial [Acidimicrobiales bacterium]|nr:inositol monophosphatase family protein [Acidimicrobiales bacterium]